MPTSDTSPPFESRYPELSLPEHGFQSTLPAHLLEGADEQTRYIMNEISRNSAATEFACRAAVDQSRHLRALNGKTFKNERGLAEARQHLDDLMEKAQIVEPLIKPVNQFMSLWEYRAFRWMVYITIFFFFTYLLPYYLQHPFDLSHFFGP